VYGFVAVALDVARTGNILRPMLKSGAGFL
jgi:hypothetical protein